MTTAATKSRKRATPRAAAPAKPSLDSATPPSGNLLDEDGADRRIGAVVRLLRTQRGWSLNDLAARCTLSTGMISQIERGLSTPSLRSLRLLAVALEVSVGQFFEPEEAPAAAPSPYIVPFGSRRILRLNSTGVTKAYLLPPGAGLFEMWEFCLAPGGSSGGDLFNHHGEKAGLMLSGRMHLWIDDQTLTLQAGDSFRFSSLQRHRIENPYGEEARALWLVAPPVSGLRGRRVG
jgi:transcriptional regulator with XRE-family HTH domain